MYKHINNYSNDVTNHYKINKIQNLKKTYYSFTVDNTFIKTSNSYSNDTYNMTKNKNKNLSYHTNHTDFMYQRNKTNNDNRRQFVIQNHYFTYQRKGNNELAIQALNIIVADLQNQINNLNSSSGGGGGEPDEIGTM